MINDILNKMIKKALLMNMAILMIITAMMMTLTLYSVRLRKAWVLTMQ